MKTTDQIDRSAVLKKLRGELEEYELEHFVTDPETGVSEGGRACDEYRSYLEETIEAIELFPPIAPPNETAFTDLHGQIKAMMARSEQYRQEAEEMKDVAEGEKHARVSSVLKELDRLAVAFAVRYGEQ